MKKNILFKTFIDKKNGAGHYYQSIKLASHLRKKNNIFFFINKNENFKKKKYIKYIFYKKVDFNSKIPNGKFDTVIYDFPINEIKINKKKNVNYFFHTNTKKKIKSNADFVIATNINQSKFLYPKHFLVSREKYLMYGQSIKRKNKEIKKKIKKIFLCFSLRTDIKKLIKFLFTLNYAFKELNDIKIDFYLHREQYKILKKFKIYYKLKINFLINTNVVKSDYDLCFCTYGNILLNTLYSRIPTVVLFENFLQKKNLQNVYLENSFKTSYFTSSKKNIINMLKNLKKYSVRNKIYKIQNKLNISENSHKISSLINNKIN